MKNKVSFMFFAILLVLCLLFTGCASTGDGNAKNVDDLPEEPPLFSDWQYKGFGQEYPVWAEEVLKEGASSTISIQFGQNLDMLIPHEELESNVISEIWVYIDPYYEEYEERYAYITLRRAQGPQLDTQGPQGMEE